MASDLIEETRAENASPENDPASDATQNQAAGTALVDKRIGQYVILNEIARGGMGIVFRSRHVTLHRVVALKMMLSGPFSRRSKSDDPLPKTYRDQVLGNMSLGPSQSRISLRRNHVCDVQLHVL